MPGRVPRRFRLTEGRKVKLSKLKATVEIHGQAGKSPHKGIPKTATVFLLKQDVRSMPVYYFKRSGKYVLDFRMTPFSANLLNHVLQIHEIIEKLGLESASMQEKVEIVTFDGHWADGHCASECPVEMRRRVKLLIAAERERAAAAAVKRAKRKVAAAAREKHRRKK